MSVDALLKDKQIQELLDRMLPSDPWPKMRLKAPALRNSSGLVGTAFDYAVRFELQRRNLALGPNFGSPSRSSTQ